MNKNSFQATLFELTGAPQSVHCVTSYFCWIDNLDAQEQNRSCLAAKLQF